MDRKLHVKDLENSELIFKFILLIKKLFFFFFYRIFNKSGGWDGVGWGGRGEEGSRGMGHMYAYG